MKSIRCHHCNHTWTFEPPLSRGEECPQCRRDARVCLNCQFYSRYANNQCTEPQAELVAEKASANFCGYFNATSSIEAQNEDIKKTKSQLDALFGDKQAESDEKQTSGSLEDELKAFLNNK